MTTRPSRHHWLVLAGYLLAALALTWPLARHFVTHVPGDGIDDPALAWNLWWIKARLVDQVNLDIFHSGWMFHPVSINLAFYTLTPLNGMLSVPLQAAFGLVAANNLVLLSSLVLGGYGAFLLAREVVGERAGSVAAAFAAGFLYAFAGPKLFYAALGQFNIASSQWIPFCALYVVRLLRARHARTAARTGAMAGLFLVFQAWAELTFASFLLLFFALAGCAAVVQAARKRASVKVMLAGFATAAAVFLAGMAPFLWAMLPDLRAEGDFFASGGGFADVFSADLAGYLLPTRLHPLLGQVAEALPFPNDKGQQVFVSYTALSTAVLGAVWLWRTRRGQAIFWLAVTGGFWLLSLGPGLRWMGHDLGIPGPFALVSLLPFFNGNRYPSRYAMMVLLGASVLMAAGLIWVFETTRGRGRAAITVAAVGLLVFEHISIPLPLSDFRIPPVYARLAQEAGDLAVLELPTGWRNGARVLGRSDVLIMMQQWYQTQHAKRRLGGNTSRNPGYKFQYFTQHPLIGDLIALMNADQAGLQDPVSAGLDGMIARHAPAAGRELGELGVGWVTLHENKATPELTRFVEEALPLELIDRWQGTDWAGEPAAIRLYRVLADPLPQERSLELAGAGGAAFLAEGWSALSDRSVRYANRPASVLVAALPERGGTLTLAPAAPGGAPALSVGGERLIPLRVSGDLNAWLLPPGAAADPVDRVTIEFAGHGVPVTDLAGAPMPIGQTDATWPAGRTLVARSAGEDVGDFAEIWLNGQNVVPGTRGYNLAAIDPDGRLLEAQAFDTFAAGGESQRLAEWLRQWPAGTVIAGAVADEASLHLTQDAIDALREIGVAADLRGQFRASHAFVGVAGAQAGTAVEAVDRIRPSSVWLGAPVDGERAYGAYTAFGVTGGE